MARNGASNTQPAVGFLGLLTLVFITLKLTNNIDWGWEWVLLPLYGPFALALFLFIVGGVLYFVGDVLEKLLEKKETAP